MRRGLFITVLALAAVFLAQAPALAGVSFVRQWGGDLAPGSLGGSIGQATDADGNVYLTDYGNHRVEKFSPTGVLLTEWGKEGSKEGQFRNPTGIDVDAAGRVFVADPGNARVQEFTADGAFLRAWGWGVSDGAAGLETCTAHCRGGLVGPGDGQFEEGPGALALAASPGGVVYVLEKSGRVQSFSSHGRFLARFGGAGLSDAHGLTIDAGGDVLVADTHRNRLVRFSPAGAFLAAYGYGVDTGANVFETCVSSCRDGLFGAHDGEFTGPQGIDTDAAGDVYVEDDNLRVQRFSPAFAFERTWGWGVSDHSNVFQVCVSSCTYGISGLGAGQFSEPAGLSVSPGGTVSVGDGTPDTGPRNQQFAADGSFLRQWGVPSHGGPGELRLPAGLAADAASGDVFVANDGDRRIEHFDAAGVFTDNWGTPGEGPGEFDHVLDVAVGGASHVFAGDLDNDRVLEFSNSGSFIRAFAGTLDSPVSVAVGPSGDVYAVQASNSGAIAHYSATGTQLDSIAPGVDTGLLHPYRLAVNPGTGDLYVIDDNRVVQLSASGAFIRAYGWGVTDGQPRFEICTGACLKGKRGAKAGQFDFGDHQDLAVGGDIAVGADGRVYVADTANHRVQQFGADGQFQRAWGWGVSDGESRFEVCKSRCHRGLAGAGPGQFGPDGPTGVASGPGGQVYVTDRLANRVQQFHVG